MPIFVAVIGMGVGICTTASSAPQVIKILRTRRVADLPLWMYSIFVIGILLWRFLSTLIQSTPPIIANALTLELAGTVLAMKLLWPAPSPSTVEEMAQANAE